MYYYNDHPPPHFHVRYNQQKAIIDIETLSILQEKLNPEWGTIYWDNGTDLAPDVLYSLITKQELPEFRGYVHTSVTKN